ncbi:hypothetical protein IDM33_14875 [Acinetobacter seifertii]|nr:hypothetical protein [Acinetobacter seifertii]
MNNLNFKTLKKYWLRFVGIAVIAVFLVLAFAWTAVYLDIEQHPKLFWVTH